MPEKKIVPLHVTQAFDLKGKEDDIDFFDTNLAFDSRLFIDPFLIKNSHLSEEKALFDRFSVIFKHAYQKSLLAISTSRDAFEELKELLYFPEVREISLGYTEKSNAGSGLRDRFASSLLGFFLENSAKRLIAEDDSYPEGKFNPITFQIFTDGIGPDGISDLSANIVMDYLIKYTQEQCDLWNIKKINLPINRDGFDFNSMSWKEGGYYKLPENPLRPGEAVIFIPKRWLRAYEIETNNTEGKVVGFLRENPQLGARFSSILSKNISDITIKEIRELLLKDKFIFKKLLEILESDHSSFYDFQHDALGFLDIREYHYKLEALEVDQSIPSCEKLLEHTKRMLAIVEEELSMRDGWKEMWKDNKYSNPQIEAVFGRRVRGIGFAYFEHLPVVTFKSESGTGSGPVDFEIIHQDCRIVIEIKKLENDAPTGKKPDQLPAYIHGIKRQLPLYAIQTKSKYAFYITGQHFTAGWTYGGKKKLNHDNRVKEIKGIVSESTNTVKARRPDFKEVFYINIDFTPKESASRLSKTP